MFKVNIYIETDSVSPKVTNKRYGYVLECSSLLGKPRTREGFGIVEGTYHKAILTAMNEALERLNQSCDVYIYMQDEYVDNMLRHNLDRWAGQEFKTSKGRPVVNEEEWRKLWSMRKQHLIKTVVGSHAFSGWIREEIERRENNV